MIRTTSALVAATAALSLFIGGCEQQRSAHDDREKAAGAQHEAEKKTIEATRESTTKITSAQVEATKKVDEAAASFTKSQQEYQTKLTSNVDALQKKIERLEAQGKVTTGKAKVALDAALPDIRAKNKALHADMARLKDATVTTWDALKNQLDNDLDALQKAVDKAPS